jgi:hypothetical protein
MHETLSQDIQYDKLKLVWRGVIVLENAELAAQL